MFGTAKKTTFGIAEQTLRRKRQMWKSVVENNVCVAREKIKIWSKKSGMNFCLDLHTCIPTYV
jgi:hypothetical protein